MKFHINSIPTHNPPQSAQMCSALVLVVKVVGVFPDVKGGERLEGTIQLGMTSV